MRPFHFTLPALATLTAAILLSLLGATGCSDHVEKASFGPDSTLVFAPKDPDGVTASITFCRKIGKKSGKPIGVSRVFTAKQKAKVRALIDLQNLPDMGDHPQTFHLDWVRPDGKSIFAKRIEHQPEGSSSSLQSALSITPGRRTPGIYTFRVYYFRELIAEKTFEVRDLAPEEA